MPGPDNGSHDPTAMTVGIVGGGQLARMLCEAAGPLAIETVVLGAHHNDAAAAVATELLVARPTEPGALESLASRCAVVTFDHEQVDLAVLGGMERRGRVLRPGTTTLALTVDKAHMRQRLSTSGIPVPPFEVLSGATQGSPASLGQVQGFAERHGWPLVLKAARGGYDGKGVWVVKGPQEAAEVLSAAQRSGTPMLVEEHVEIQSELAVVVARRSGGQIVAWPAAETAQVDGVCREVLVPGSLPPAVAAEAVALATEVAHLAAAVGVLAVEMFFTGEGLVVNELAARPHNSGHWTMEGAETSQFENHLRAVLDLPLGATALRASQVASVNVFGDQEAPDPRHLLSQGLEVPGAHLHLYGKQARPGRKLGHVTVCGDQLDSVRDRAWSAARALGTPVPPELAVVG